MTVYSQALVFEATWKLRWCVRLHLWILTKRVFMHSVVHRHFLHQKDWHMIDMFTKYIMEGRERTHCLLSVEYIWRKKRRCTFVFIYTYTVASWWWNNTGCCSSHKYSVLKRIYGKVLCVFFYYCFQSITTLFTQASQSGDREILYASTVFVCKNDQMCLSSIRKYNIEKVKRWGRMKRKSLFSNFTGVSISECRVIF